MNSFIETIKNNTYALKLMWKICSSQVIHKAITRFLGYFEWLFYSAFFMKHVINSLVTEEKISSIILFIVVTIGVFGCISLYNSFVKGAVEHKPVFGNLVIHASSQRGCSESGDKHLFHSVRLSVCEYYTIFPAAVCVAVY